MMRIESEYTGVYPFVGLPAPIKVDKAHYRECLLETLGMMFGEEAVSPLIKADTMSVTVDEKTALIDLNTKVCHRSQARWYL